MIDLGIIGCGAVVHWNYAKTLPGRSDIRVPYVHDINADQAESAARLFGAQAVPLDHLLENSDAVAITTPPSSHSQLVSAALRPGRTILCEKPFMTQSDEATRACRRATEIGATLCVGQFRRVYPQVELARDLVRLGLIGEVTQLSASEGGRFTWQVASDYVIRDRHGGVLWDTGAHTLDMALFASGLDREANIEIGNVYVERDKPEPSHRLHSSFTLEVEGRSVGVQLALSRKEALPNLVRISGTRGQVIFVAGLDNKVRIGTAVGSTVITAAREHHDLLECFDLQLRQVFLSGESEEFRAERVLGQIRILERLTDE